MHIERQFLTTKPTWHISLELRLSKIPVYYFKKLTNTCVKGYQYSLWRILSSIFLNSHTTLINLNALERGQRLVQYPVISAIARPLVLCNHRFTLYEWADHGLPWTLITAQSDLVFFRGIHSLCHLTYCAEAQQML